MKKPKSAAPQPQTETQQAFALYDRLGPIMEGQGSPIQGNAIAMLLGVWLHGHRALAKDGSTDWEKTREIRSNLMVLTTRAGFAYAADRDRQSSKEAEDGPKGRSGNN